MAEFGDGDEVRQADLVGRRFERTHYERVVFIDCDLSEIFTHHAGFDECAFRRCRFNGSRHESTAFTSCAFVDVDFFGAAFTGCKMTGSTFKACDLRSVTVDGGAWDFLNLPRHELSTCRFSNVKMTESDLTGIRAKGSTFVDIDLTGCELADADLRDADLRGSLLYSLDPLDVLLDGARVTADQALLLAANLGLSID